MKAADLMTRYVLTVAPGTALVDAARLMLEHKVSGLPVTDSSHRLVGVITESDLLRRVEIGTDSNAINWFARLFSLGAQADAYVHTHARKVGDVMTRDPVSVEQATPISEVVALMEAKKIKRVPVLADGRLVGVVSRADLLRAVADMLSLKSPPLPTDEAIRRLVAEDLAHQPWSAHASLSVQVDDGVVTLSGMIFDERARAAIRVLAENVPGVRRVVDELVWADPVSGTYFGVA